MSASDIHTYKHIFITRVFKTSQSQITTSGSAVAEGPHDVLVSRNSATYKTSHLKSIVWHYLQTDGQTDGQTHNDGIYRA